MRRTLLSLSVAAAVGTLAVDANAAFVTLTNSGANNTLTPCQGQSYPNSTYAPPTAQGSSPCVVPTNPAPPLVLNGTGSFPGLAGTWQLIRIDNDRNVSANGSSVGNIDQAVWRRTNAGLTNQFVIGHRLQLTPGATWNEPADDNMSLPGTNGCNSQTGQEFEVNDIVRTGWSSITTVQAGHRIGTQVSTDSGLFAIGRTDRGWAYQSSNNLCTNWTAANNPIPADNTIPGTTYCGVGGVAGAPVSNPTRNLGFIAFRQDVSPGDDDGSTEGNSQWNYVYYTKPSPVTIPPLTANAVRIEMGGEDVDTLAPSEAGNVTIPLACRYRATTSGYTP